MNDLSPDPFEGIHTSPAPLPPDQDRRRKLLLAKRAILKSRTDLISFAQYMRPDMTALDDASRSAYMVSRHHDYIAKKLEALERGEIKRLIISCPPRHGKSELAQKTFVPWCMGRNPSWHVITATYNSTFAEDFGRAVRGMIDDPRYQNVFPGVALQDGAKSVGRIETQKGAVATFVGRGGSLTGRGGHLIVVDDPLKDRTEADSPTTRNSLWTWWTQVLSTRLMTEDGRILIIMTRWHDDDIVGRLTDPNNAHYNKREAARWTVINLPALAEPGDPLGREKNEPLWPQRFSTTYLAQVRNSDARGFSALYQGRPSPDEGLFFHPKDIVEYQSMKDIPQPVTMFAASDHAVSTQQWADKSAMLMFAVDADDHIWLHPDTILDKLNSEQTVERMLGLMERHRPLFWWAETGHITKSIGPFLRKRMIEKRVYSALVELAPVKDKQTRAQSIKGRMSMGMVHFPAWAPWYEEARHQILTFPAGSNDDFVDALSMVGLGLALQRTRKTRQTTSTAPKEGTLGWLKAQSHRQDIEKHLKRESEGW